MIKVKLYRLCSLDDKIDNLYYYMQFIKFGFGRAVRDASRLIQI